MHVTIIGHLVSKIKIIIFTRRRFINKDYFSTKTDLAAAILFNNL